MDMCEQYMGQIGEMEVYSAYKKNPKSRKQFEDYMCRGTELRGYCAKMPDEEDNKAKDELWGGWNQF